MRRRAASPDLSPNEFRDLLVDHSFAWLGRSVGKYVDIRHRGRGLIDPVRRGRRINRRATLEMLLAGRIAIEAEQAASAAARANIEATAALLAPHVLPPCRADLDGARAVAQLADDYLTRFATSGHVNFSDLIKMGWRADQLKAHGDAARSVADRRQIVTV